MKHILKYTAAAAMVLAFSACEEIPDYQTVIDAAPQLTYVNPKSGDTFETLVVHRPVGSSASFYTEFQPHSNTSNHGDVTVSFEYDKNLVSSYNEKHGTSYVAFPEEYITVENPVVVIPAGATVSADTVRVSLAENADLSVLTERAYLAPYKVTSPELGTSEEKGNLWLIFNTEINLVRPITSRDDMVGFPASTSGWSADCSNPANLFDGNTGTGVGLPGSSANIIIDMQKERMITGLHFNLRGINTLSVEYSKDGHVWNQAGTPASGEFVNSGNDRYVAFYDYLECQYLRLIFSGSNMTVNEVSPYIIESTEPTIYTLTGVDNVVTGKIVHKKGVGSTSDFSSAFKVYSTISSPTGYSVNASVDNSLVAAYNQKHGTAYKALPSSNIEIQNSSLSIAAGENASAESVTLSLKGDLSGLTEKGGYLVPVKLSATGAVVSESKGVVYAIVNTEFNIIRAIKSMDDLVGFPAGGRSSWSADVQNASNLFDDNNGTSVNFASGTNVLTVNLGGRHLVTGINMWTYILSNPNVEYSLDGTTWTSAGTAKSDEVVAPGSSWSAGNYCIAFADYIEAAYLRMTFSFSGYYRNMCEFSIYELESTEPTVYTVCGTNNTFTGKIVHHTIAGSSATLSAAFNAMTTVSSASGYAVGAVVDNSLVNAYNRENGTKYATMDASYVEISGTPCQIAANANKSADQISIAIKGDLSKFTDANGYLVPVKLTAPAGAVVSQSRGVVYVIMTVETNSSLLKENFDINSIEGSLVADRSGWKIIECDEGGVHSGSYPELFDGKTDTYVRTWGGPVSFTVDLGKEVDMTGLVITARDGHNYQPNTISIRTSLDDNDYDNVGTASKSENSLVSSGTSSYASFYGSKKVRYLKIEAGYGSNMGTAEFNIYTK